ncbi:unnamed protein product [Symbiodinium sp. CCMP2456]|nr:unnamed protein product [Symbiodinium sp. CCMP2456]
MDPEAEQRCADKLQSVGLWGESLATLNSGDAEGVAQQLVDELGLPFYDDVVAWVASCIANAQGMLELSQRATGLHGDDLSWRTLQHKKGEHKGAGPGIPVMTLALPEKGKRKRKRGLDLAASEGDRQAAERREREALCVRLMAVLRRFGAPCLDEFSAGFDPERASAVVAGRIRNSSLRRYLRFLEEFVFWMYRAKLREPPFSAGDAIDFLFMLADKPCGPTIPGAFLKSLAWFERVSGFPFEERISVKTVLLSTRDILVKELKKPGIPVHRAPRLPGAMIAALERLVSNEKEAMGIRAGAYYRLLKCWGTLRYDDIQHLSPSAIRFFAGRRMASYAEAATLTTAVNRRLVDAEGQRLIPQELVEMWTEHSERATLPTILDGFGLDPRDRDALGRWRPEGSDVYSRSFSGKIRRIHRYFASELERLRLAGDVDDYDVLDAAFQWLRARRGFSSDDAEGVVDAFKRALESWTAQDPIVQESDGEEEVAEEEPEAPTEAPDAVERTSGYVLVFSKRGTARLHRAGKEGCWMARARHFDECRVVQEMPEPDECSYRCRLCWPGPEEMNDSSDDSSEDSSGSAMPGVAEDSGTSPRASWERVPLG